jgi:uncharacterized protein
MLGELSKNDAETLLQDQVVGRIGCSMEGKIYVVPINYAFDGKYIYAHSKEGLKIEIMRQNPEVCFEVDCYSRNGSWKSVIAWGTFEELKNTKSQRAAMKIFTSQMSRLIPNEKAFPSHGAVKGAEKNNDPFKSVVFRIKISEMTGRFEKRQKVG